MFGCVALALAAIGLYGVISYGIARRRGEIAVRIALGARPGRVVAMIVGETMRLLVTGLALGGALAYAASRLIDSRLYGIAPHDPLTQALATTLLVCRCAHRRVLAGPQSLAPRPYGSPAQRVISETPTTYVGRTPGPQPAHDCLPNPQTTATSRFCLLCILSFCLSSPRVSPRLRVSASKSNAAPAPQSSPPPREAFTDLRSEPRSIASTTYNS